MLLDSLIIGQGEPIVVLHGFLGMGENWKTIGRVLAQKGYEVHLPDQRNHGRSFHSDKFNYDLMATDLYEYIKSKNLEQVILIGHSMGGKTAMFFAGKWPKMVKKLVVVDISPAFSKKRHQHILDGLLAIDIDGITDRRQASDQLRPYVRDMAMRQFLLKNLYRTTSQGWAFRFNLPVLNRQLARIGEALPLDVSYTGKALFVKGGMSDHMKDNDPEVIKKHFPNAQITEIPGAGHWPHSEKPQEFLKRLLEFIWG